MDLTFVYCRVCRRCHFLSLSLAVVSDLFVTSSARAMLVARSHGHFVVDRARGEGREKERDEEKCFSWARRKSVVRNLDHTPTRQVYLKAETFPPCHTAANSQDTFQILISPYWIVQTRAVRRARAPPVAQRGVRSAARDVPDRRVSAGGPGRMEALG